MTFADVGKPTRPHPLQNRSPQIGDQLLQRTGKCRRRANKIMVKNGPTTLAPSDSDGGASYYMSFERVKKDGRSQRLLDRL
jgi:hypothetical protein